MLIDIKRKAQTGKHLYVSEVLWGEGFHCFFSRTDQSFAFGTAFVNNFNPHERQSKKQSKDATTQVLMDIGYSMRFDLFEFSIQPIKPFKPFVFSNKVW